MSKSKFFGQIGFSLVELITICAVIGILASIAISAFSKYQETARDQEALVLLRSIVVAEEAYFTDNNSYISCDQSNCLHFFPEIGQLPALIEVDFVSTGNSCTATASHRNGTGKVFNWSS